MARLRRLLKSALEDRSPRFMLGTIALAVVISLVAGFAIGYKVEESRAKPAKKATSAAAKKKKTKPTKAVVKPAPDAVGGVFRVTPTVLLVLTSDKKTVRVSLGAATRVAVAAAGNASSIAVGDRVLFQPTPTSATAAAEIVVLPGKALFGTPVTAVVPGTSMTLKAAQGSAHVISTKGATVFKTGPGNRKSLAVHDHVIVHYFLVGAKARHVASEIVKLPASSKFR